MLKQNTRIGEDSSGSADNFITKDYVLEKDGGDILKKPAYPVFDACNIVKP